MKYVTLGRTGLKVSPVCLGCMTYGVPDRGNHPWTLDEAASRPLLQRAIEHGINFFDTANTYSTARPRRSSDGRCATSRSATRS